MNHFNAETFPLHGRRLIEASAGTGKTYNIANLYLRLLLGEGAQPLTVDQILVVTFTRAATNELRGRIREKVETTLREYRKDTNRHEACRLLNNALVCMDEACIFTIHGFAVRVIQTFLFETGALAEMELTEGENQRKDKALADLWRQLQMAEDKQLRSFVDAVGFNNHDAFYKYFGSNTGQAEILPRFELATPPQPLVELLLQAERYVESQTKIILDTRNQLAIRWKKIADKQNEKALKVVLSPLIDFPVAGKDKPQSSAGRLLTFIEASLESTECDIKMPGGDLYARMEQLKNSNANDTISLFVRDLSIHVQSAISTKSMMNAAFRSLLLQWLRARMAETDLASMQLDDVVRLINKTLSSKGPESKALRRIITATYPVCMVDEFQDTDPEQFALFNKLYSGVDGTGLFMIGDPKQSIYAFRGADIFSYLDVRTQVKKAEAEKGEESVFSLDTNFRSKKNLVSATNALFCELKIDEPKEGESKAGEISGKKMFLYEGIEYSPVKSCEEQPYNKNKGLYKAGNKKNKSTCSDKPLVFIGNPADPQDKAVKFNRETLMRRFAADAAARSAALLGKEGATVTDDKGERALQAGDIAILVRTGTEARVMREELLKLDPPLLSVYQSQRDSVFTSALFAEDLYHILCAMDEPKNKALIKVALATPLFRGFASDFSLLDSIETDDRIYEQLIREFDGYRNAWETHGVLTALNILQAQRELAQGFVRQPDCDRLLTDFRHLGELLQEQAQVCSSRQQLLIWYARQLQGDSEIDQDSKRIRLESDENLVKIVTIHVSKGLEYPVVFLPFFFFPWHADLNKSLPTFHCEPGYHPQVDFASPDTVVTEKMQQELLAEDMRLLYVAITRAVYQCYIGISASVKGNAKTPVFPLTVWAHMLEIHDTNPGWKVIRHSLEKKLASCIDYVDYSELGAITRKSLSIVTHVSGENRKLVSEVTLPPLPHSSWVITSYSSLAHARKDPGIRHGASDETLISSETPLPLETASAELATDDSDWQQDIRYRIKGSKNTGDCLHAIYEALAEDPARLSEHVQNSLRRHGLEKPEENLPVWLAEAEKQALIDQRGEDVVQWINATLDVPLLAVDASSSLRQLYLARQALPEMDFDFSLGSAAPAKIHTSINTVLDKLGVAGIALPGQSELEGLMTGSIDLLFIHNKKVYVLDYKSNTLGKAPRFYNRENMTQAMHDSRYDLQYLIYSVAAHRYMQQRLGRRYAFDASSGKAEYSFGGVFYLFLRGMGLAEPEYREHGIWFHRPDAEHIISLDNVFRGEAFTTTEVKHG